jgi:hypothetical protein
VCACVCAFVRVCESEQLYVINMSVQSTHKITDAIQTSSSHVSTRYVQRRHGRLTPMVAIKNPARWESHPNISEDRQGTEDTIIS